MAGPFDLTKSADHPRYEAAGGGRWVSVLYDAAKQPLAQNEIARVINVKASEYVVFVVATLVSADANAGTFDVGDDATADGYVDNKDAVTPLDSETLGRSLAGAEAYAGGKVYEVDDTIDIKAIGANGLTTAKIRLHAFIMPKLEARV